MSTEITATPDIVLMARLVRNFAILGSACKTLFFTRVWYADNSFDFSTGGQWSNAASLRAKAENSVSVFGFLAMTALTISWYVILGIITDNNLNMKSKTVNNILHQTRDIYNRIATDFSKTREYQWAGFNKFKSYLKPGDKVLDLGCGNGRLAELFADSQIIYKGIDNSEELIKIAQEKYKDLSQVEFKVGDATNMPKQNDNYNAVFLIAVLHHIPTRELRLKVLRDIYDIVTPGGHLIMYNWNLWQWKNRKKYWPYLLNYIYKIRQGIWSIKDGFIPWKLMSGWESRYVHSFTCGELRRLLQWVGFEVEELYYEWQGEKSSLFKAANTVAVVRRRR